MPQPPDATHKCDALLGEPARPRRLFWRETVLRAGGQAAAGRGLDGGFFRNSNAAFDHLGGAALVLRKLGGQLLVPVERVAEPVPERGVLLFQRGVVGLDRGEFQVEMCLVALQAALLRLDAALSARARTKAEAL